MFWNTLKRQFFYFCLFSGGFGASNIVEAVLSLDISRLLINLFMVLTLAFILYALSYPLVRFYKKLTTLLLLLSCVVVFVGLPVDEADANWKDFFKRNGRKVLIFTASVIGYDKADDLWDMAESYLQGHADRFYYWVGDTTIEVWQWLTEEETYKYSVSCSQCSYVFRTNDYNLFMKKSGTGVCHDDYMPYNP